LTAVGKKLFIVQTVAGFAEILSPMEAIPLNGHNKGEEERYNKEKEKEKEDIQKMYIYK